MTALDQYTEQRIGALQAANEVRCERARLLEAPVDMIRAARLLRDLPEALVSMGVYSFLLRIRRFGPTRARKLLGRLEIDATYRLGGGVRQHGYHGMSDRQRLALAERLEAEA